MDKWKNEWMNGQRKIDERCYVYERLKEIWVKEEEKTFLPKFQKMTPQLQHLIL